MTDFEGSRSEFLKLLAEFDEAPAFVARARAPQAALETCLVACQTKRDQLLKWPRFHWSVLARQVARDWTRLQPLLAGRNAVEMLEDLDTQLKSDMPVRYSFIVSDRTALCRFLESADRFNRKWTDYLVKLDLCPINGPRHDYNRYYVVEKACALGSEALIRNFSPLAMIDHRFFFERFPLLECPALRQAKSG